MELQDINNRQQNIEAPYYCQETISLKRMITGNGNECSPFGEI